MRYLHPVGIHEKFVASGVHTCQMPYLYGDTLNPYPESQLRDIQFLGEIDGLRYFSATRLTGVVEYWSIHELPDKSQLVRADRDGQGYDNGMHVLGEILISPEKRAERMEMRVYVDKELVAEANYLFFEDRVEIARRTIIARSTYGEREHSEMALPSGYHVDFGRITISRGFIIDASLRGNLKKVPVFSPLNYGGYELQFNPKHLMKGSLKYYEVELIEEDMYKMGKISLPSRKCQLMIIDQDGAGFGYECAVDQYGILLYDGSGYTYYLTEYARRPDPKTKAL